MSERIDCGILAIPETEMRARETVRAALRLLSAIMRRARQGWCLHRGPQLRRAHHGRLYLECMDCGSCSPGVDVARPRVG